MKRIPSLDGLRAISIALVVLGHLAVRGHAPSVWLNYSNTGVRMFFVISGYLITTILLREQTTTGEISLKQFYIRRAFRILPAAFVFVAVMTALYWPVLRWYQIVPAFLYLTNFSIASQSWLLGHLWSLSVEEQFYLLWPALLKCFHRRKMLILGSVIAFAPLYQACLYYLKVHNGGYGTLPSVANNVAVGCVLAIIAPKLPNIPKAVAVLMIALIAFIPVIPGDSLQHTLLILFVLQPILHFSMAGLLLHVVQHPYRVLNCAPVVWAGHISYSLYLWQQPFCYSPYLHSAFPTAFAVVCACVSYYCIERPILLLRDKRSTTIRRIAPLEPVAA